MQVEKHEDFVMKVYGRADQRRIPVNGTIEISHRCPLTCSHCYNNLPMDDRGARSLEMTFEDHCRLIDEIAEAGCLFLCFTGGEIFARRDFMDIYDHARKRGFLITLFTNGTLIDERIADRLAARRPLAIEITLYGATKATYERLTGIPGSYDQCMRGIHLLLERNLPLKLKTVGTSINVHEVFEMKQMAEELGVPFKFDAMLNPRIDCSSAPAAVRLSPEEIVMLDMRDGKRMAEWRALAEELAPPPTPPGEAQKLYHCGAGVNSWAVDPYGFLSMCVISKVEQYNVRGGSFREGWEFLSRTVREKTVTRPTKCNSCKLKSMCGMCPANAELEKGDPEEPVEWLCYLAHLRAAAFDVDVTPHGECENCTEDAQARLGTTIEEMKQRVADRPMMVPMPLPGSESAGCGSDGGCSSCRG
jgi:radical SAM protein with 4Fe4S-binding SPASM domain